MSKSPPSGSIGVADGAEVTLSPLGMIISSEGDIVGGGVSASPEQTTDTITVAAQKA